MTADGAASDGTLFDDEFHRWLIENAADPFVVVDEDLVVRWVGPTIDRLVGWRPDELVGRSVVGLLTEESMARAAHGLTHVRDISVNPRWLATPVPVTVITADGNLRELDATARPAHHPSFDGWVIQLHPPSAAERFGAITRAILDSRDDDDVLPLLPPLLEHDLPGARVALGLGWTGTGFERAVGDIAPLSLTEPGDDDRLVLERLVAADAEPGDVIDRLATTTRREAVAAGFRACWAAPVIPSGPRHPGAVLVLWHWTTGGPGIIMQGRVARLVDLARLTLRWGETQRQLAWDVSHDQLTDLVNRTRFMQLVEATAGRPRAVLYCDLDDFKPVNDRYGHRIGDRVLEIVADRLRDAAAGHVVARLSGDEFAVLVEPVDDETGAVEIGRRILDRITAPIELPDTVVRIGVSIGVAFDPAGTDPPHLVVDEADRMLRTCKSGGKNGLASTTVEG